MIDRVLRAVPMLLLSASCVHSGKAVPVTAASGPVTPHVSAPAQPTAIPTPRRAPATFQPEPAFAPAVAVQAAPFLDQSRSPQDRMRSLDCLTAAVYYEARSESLDGQRAVAQVVLNRVRHPAFPNSVCGVVFQGSNRATGCQFSFTCDGSLGRRREPAAWQRARAVAEAALDGAVDPTVGYSTHYHTNAVSPWWSAGLKLVTSVGSHIFYGWRGRNGTAGSFQQRYSGAEPGIGAAPTFDPDAQPEHISVRSGSVTVHRGQIFDPAPADIASGEVRIHRGPTADAPALAEDAEQPTFGVVVHRG